MTFDITRRTLGQVIAKCAKALGLRYTIEFTADGGTVIAGDQLTDVKEIVNLAQRSVQDSVGLEKLREQFIVPIAAPTTSGSITWTNGDATVTATTDLFATTDVGRHLRDPNGVWFKIITRTDARNVEIECKYPYDTAAGETIEMYTLFHKIGTAGVKRLRTFESVIYPSQNKPLALRDVREIYKKRPKLDSFGTPARVARVEFDGCTCLLLDPVPNDNASVIVWGVRECAVITDNAIASDLSEEYHQLWQALSVYHACLDYGSDKAIAKAREKLNIALDDIGLGEDPEINMIMRYSQGSVSKLDDMHTWGVSVD